MSVEEYRGVGAVVGNVTAIDKDQNDNNPIVYKILGNWNT